MNGGCEILQMTSPSEKSQLITLTRLAFIKLNPASNCKRVTITTDEKYIFIPADIS